MNLPSPAFVVLTLTLGIFLRGAVLYLGESQSGQLELWSLSISALCGGNFIFLTGVAATVVLRSV